MRSPRAPRSPAAARSLPAMRACPTSCCATPRRPPPPPAASTAEPRASQPGGGTFATGDARMLDVVLRDDRLLATHTVGINGDATARWYEFDVSGLTPMLKQQANIRPASGVDTYYPSIALAANGDIGINYMQSSASEFVSMYV